jgi:hypothetical protein
MAAARGLEKRLDAQAVPALHPVQRTLHIRVSAPGLVVVAAGIYLASYLHVWSQFFVGWGLAAAIAIGAIGGAYRHRARRNSPNWPTPSSPPAALARTSPGRQRTRRSAARLSLPGLFRP